MTLQAPPIGGSVFAVAPGANAPGAAETRIGPATFAPGTIDTPIAGPDPRTISNVVVAGQGVTEGPPFSGFAYAWGQFIDHDIDLTPGDGVRDISIPIPPGDPAFVPGSSIKLTRAVVDPVTGTQVNKITGWMDASMVYGSDAVTAAALRTADGHMATSAGGNLPVDPHSGLVMAGDVRAAENPDLTALQTLFVREHNFWADRFIVQHPDWTGDQVYDAARAVVIAEVQSITYHEFLPLILGAGAPGAYAGFNPAVNPAITQDFAGSAFRFGHTIVSDAIGAIDNQGNPTSEQDLADVFFEPASAFAATGADGLLRHLAGDLANKFDVHLVDALRNLLTDPPDGQDLAAINIERGRDLGLAPLNAERIALGLAPYGSIDQITADPDVAANLSAVYGGDVDKVELWIGGLAEAPVPGGLVGSTFGAIIDRQFTALRDGNPYWYQAQGLPPDQMATLDHTTLADLILRDTDTGAMQDNAFLFTERRGSDTALAHPDSPQLVVGIDADGAVIAGGPADDTVIAGAGIGQTLTGDAGRDTFVFLAPAAHADTIADFAPGIDRLDFEASVARGLTFADLSIAADADGSAIVSLGADAITLAGVAPSALSAADVVFDVHGVAPGALV